MSFCGYTWKAVHLLDPKSNYGKRATMIEQRCCLPKDHPGDHRSLQKVTTPNTQRR